jgi:hypothetical protein
MENSISGSKVYLQQLTGERVISFIFSSSPFPTLPFLPFLSSFPSLSIMATSSQNQTTPRLIVGTHVPGVVRYHQWDYYYYRPNGDYGNDLRLQVAVSRGDVDVYIGTSWADRPFFSVFSNKVLSYIFSSASLGDETILIRHRALANLCQERGDHDCYFIIGVFGVYETATLNQSSYTLHLSTIDLTITLSSGQPVRGTLDRNEIAYYKYSVTQPQQDIILSVTPFTGDPDMIVSLPPLLHPTLTNYTWMVASWGADILTIQHTDLAQYCQPVPSLGKNCDLFIGIYAWQNTSYSLMVHMDTMGNDTHPIVLIDGQPQASFVRLGSYVYYTFYINGQVSQGSGGATAHQIINGLQITLTSTDGDQDVYVAFGANTEPGKVTYDYKSTNFGGVSDEISISASMPHFCVDCYVNIAVFGFKAGHYSLVATTKGVMELQSGIAIGGHLEQSQYRYYSFYNNNPTALISFALTAISGDPDLYINIFTPSSSTASSSAFASTSLVPLNDPPIGGGAGGAGDGAPYQYPTSSHYLWKSIHAGRDEILIDYSDHLFCVDCIYIIGVFSYRNSSYTLLVTNTHDAIINLIPNRPQIVHIRDTTHTPTAALRYFKLLSHISYEDITVSVTPFGSSAHCILYLEQYPIATYNGTLPNPSDPTSYSYDTTTQRENSLFIPGPHSQPMLFIVGVVVNIPTSYSITMSISSLPVILRSGIPQLNYVQKGSMAQFIFYLNENDASADTQITITALSGDPDLFISEGVSEPVCQADPTMYWRILCSNFTWASTTYSTDQIVISKDLPCSAIMPGTTIKNTCNPNLYGIGPLRIGVFGYATSRFMIMASIRGQHLTLLPGTPQLSITSPSIICSTRNPENGVCVNSASSTSVFAAYFTYSVSNRQDNSGGGTTSGNNMNNNAIYITVRPVCNTTTTASSSAATAACSPGCDCDPIGLYVLSCPASRCTANDKFPSYLPGHNKGQMLITSTSNSMLISTFTPSLYCNPSLTGETCIYYIALITKQTHQHISFTIDIQNPDDVSLVSCDQKPTPDGYRLSKLITNPLVSSFSSGGSNLISSNTYGKYFELCSSGGSGSGSGNEEKLIVSIEQCLGTSEIFACSNDACDSFLPSEKSWEYYANTQESCQITSTTTFSKACHPNLVSPSIPSLTLPEKTGNYHVKVNATGRYFINIQNTINGEIIEPRFAFDNYAPTSSLSSSSGIHVDQSLTTVTSLTLSWNPIGILMPGESKPKRTRNILYLLYVFDESALTALAMNYKFTYHLPLVLETKCGLDYVANTLGGGETSKIIAIPGVEMTDSSSSSSSSSLPMMSYTITGLTKGKSYAIYLLSVCDGTCLRQISKSIVTSHYVSCGVGTVDCMTQKFYYGSIISQTKNHGHGNNDEDNQQGSSSSSSSGVDSVILIVIVCLVALLSFLFGAFSYYYRNKKELDEIQAFEMVDFNSSSGGGGGFGDTSSHSTRSNTSRTQHTSFFDFFNQFMTTSSGFGSTSRGPAVLNSQTPRLNEGSSSPGSNRSMMSKVKLPNQSSPFFSNYSPLIREDQDDEEEVTINL